MSDHKCVRKGNERKGYGQVSRVMKVCACGWRICKLRNKVSGGRRTTSVAPALRNLPDILYLYHEIRLLRCRLVKNTVEHFLRFR